MKISATLHSEREENDTKQLLLTMRVVQVCPRHVYKRHSNVCTFIFLRDLVFFVALLTIDYNKVLPALKCAQKNQSCGKRDGKEDGTANNYKIYG